MTLARRICCRPSAASFFIFLYGMATILQFRLKKRPLAHPGAKAPIALASPFYEGPFNDEPDLVLFTSDAKRIAGWKRLIRHRCNGFVLDFLSGFVLPLSPSHQGRSILKRLAAEEFCGACKRRNLNWGVEAEHSAAYHRYLDQYHLVAGDPGMLLQGVYPLAATGHNLALLGITHLEVPAGAALLVLGSNCD
jgi:hypothetical protein